MEMSEYLKQKYNDVIERSFKTKLEVFLVDRVKRLSHIRGITPEEFNDFKITEEIANNYSEVWQMKESEEYYETDFTIQQIDMLIEHWYKEESDILMELQRQHKALFVTEYFPFSDFEVLFPEEPKKRICHYCKISDYEIEMLRKRREIYSKRQRGYFIELDRIEPNKEYSKDNCVLACYWCNNAKSDEFSLKESSEHIGPAIESIWKERKSKAKI